MPAALLAFANDWVDDKRHLRSLLDEQEVITKALAPLVRAGLDLTAPGMAGYLGRRAERPQRQHIKARRDHIDSVQTTSRPKALMQKHTILFLAANPGGTDRLALDREARAIQAELKRTGYRDCFEFETRWAAEPIDLLRELRKLKPTVVHFSGHVQLVSTAALEKTIEAAGSSVKLVVLSACYSEAHAAALLAHVDCVVGMRDSIEDDAARSFALGFYGGLGARAPVAAAYKQGCAAISLEGLRDADRPQLRVRDGADADKLVLAGHPPASATVAGDAAISARRPKVDIGILTIRDDEFRAVLGVFSDQAGIINGAHREYTLRRAEAGNGEHYTVAVLRQVEQGNGEAQDAARDLIEDLAPKLVLVVGIAGGLPSDDVKLGDVILATRIHDFTVEARKAGEDPTYAAAGGPITKALAARIANLASREAELGDWTAELPPQPAVSWTAEGELYGTAPWQRDLRDKLARHYGDGSTPRAPMYMAGAIASSDRLVKDPALLFPWITTARSILAVEMESGGVYRASRERCPMLAIRGISDIVGLKRSDSWMKFACVTAAAFTRAFLRTRPVPIGSSDVPEKPAPLWRRRALLVTAALSALLATTLILSAGARHTTCRVPGVHTLCLAAGLGDVPSAAEQTLWDDALMQDGEAGLKTYLQQYPTGVYADEARSRIMGCRDEETPGAIVDIPFDLFVSSADPLPTEKEARSDAVERGNQQASKACEPLKLTDQLLSAKAELSKMDCTSHMAGFTCRADGQSVCRVQKRIKSKHCRQPGGSASR